MGKEKTIKVVVQTTTGNAASDVSAAVTQAVKAQLPEILGPLAAPLAPVLGEIFGKSAARQLKRAPSGIPTREEILATEPYGRFDELFAYKVLEHIAAMEHNPSLTLIDGQTRIGAVVYHDPRNIKLEFIDKGIAYVNPTYYDKTTEIHFISAEVNDRLRAWWAVLNASYPAGQRSFRPGEGITADPHTWSRKIYISSGFRPLGTNMELYGDKDGIIDSTDPWGHWNGYAVDVARKETGYAFNIPGSLSEVQEVMESTAESVGFRRLRDPYTGAVSENEHHHFYVQG